MKFTADEKALALFTSYRALVAALIDSGSLDPALFESHVAMGIGRLEAVGNVGASSAMAEALEPMLVDIRRVSQLRGGS